MKILVIDDHRLFGDGLSLIFGSYKLPAELVLTENGEEALAMLKQQDFSLILLDLNLPGISGFTLLREFKSIKNCPPVLVVSASQSMSDAKGAIHQGAMGFISKSTDSKTLLDAIDTVLSGERYVPKGWEDIILTAQESSSSLGSKNSDKITGRQLEVLHLVAQGYANKTIADKLNLSENTVKVHLREVFRALDVNNRTACVKAAQLQGLIQKN